MLDRRDPIITLMELYLVRSVRQAQRVRAQEIQNEERRLEVEHKLFSPCRLLEEFNFSDDFSLQCSGHEAVVRSSLSLPFPSDRRIVVQGSRSMQVKLRRPASSMSDRSA